ncbi:MAG: hypothetical protein E3J87_06255 [Candidatus Cloacimonadota bacterium]|nr:MAG: hypothetical protein E3J87_06255 [Candidatus Cloacimonadota bacterium]
MNRSKVVRGVLFVIFVPIAFFSVVFQYIESETIKKEREMDRNQIKELTDNVKELTIIKKEYLKTFAESPKKQLRKSRADNKGEPKIITDTLSIKMINIHNDSLFLWAFNIRDEINKNEPVYILHDGNALGNTHNPIDRFDKLDLLNTESGKYYVIPLQKLMNRVPISCHKNIKGVEVTGRFFTYGSIKKGGRFPDSFAYLISAEDQYNPFLHKESNGIEIFIVLQESVHYTN